MREKSLYLINTKTHQTHRVHLTVEIGPTLAVPRTIRMLCGKKFAESRVSEIEKLDWDTYDETEIFRLSRSGHCSDRVCSQCFFTTIARIGRYKHNVTYEPDWQDFSDEIMINVDGVISFEHNVFAANLSGYHKIVDGLLFHCDASTPGAYPAIRCRNSRIVRFPIEFWADCNYNGQTDYYLFNEHHQYQMFRFDDYESVSSVVEKRRSFGYMLRNQRSLNEMDKVLIHKAIIGSF